MTGQDHFRIVINWRALDDETDHDRIFLDRVQGLDCPLADLQASLPGSRSGISSGEHGKGGRCATNPPRGVR